MCSCPSSDYEGAIDYYLHTIGKTFLDLHVGTSEKPLEQTCRECSLSISIAISQL